MKEAIDLCRCLQKMLILRKVTPYDNSKESLFSDSVEEGTLCISNTTVSDNGYYEGINWIYNIEVEEELYPIYYCPICGKRIEYKKVQQLKL